MIQLTTQSKRKEVWRKRILKEKGRKERNNAVWPMVETRRLPKNQGCWAKKPRKEETNSREMEKNGESIFGWDTLLGEGKRKKLGGGEGGGLLAGKKGALMFYQAIEPQGSSSQTWQKRKKPR